MQRTTPFSRFLSRIALLGSALLALILFAPAAVEAVPISAVPISFTLDNANQTVTSPTSGFTTVNFSGTVIIDSNYHLTDGSIDMAYEATLTKHLGGLFTNAFAIFLNGGTGTFSGAIFNVTVPAGTSIALYSFNSSGLASMVNLFVAFDGKTGSGGPPLSASQAYSVKVIGGNPVPDRGSSALLLGLSLAAIYFSQRVFVSDAKQAAA